MGLQVLNAWAALDVFVFGLIASILEISQFSQFIVGDKCDEINVLLKKYANTLLDGDDRCFDVQTTLGAGCWILFGVRWGKKEEGEKNDLGPFLAPPPSLSLYLCLPLF